jgi:NAD-dependent deacetylase
MSTIPATLAMALEYAKSIVFFTGAGMSADSGIPTFRGKGTGLWKQFDPEDLATRSAFQRQPGLVWSWYEWRRMQVAKAQPNPGHLAIAQLAARPDVRVRVRVVIQNVDDLHERAGSHRVIHLHGSLFAPRCLACERRYRGPLVDDPAKAEAAALTPPASRCRGGGDCRHQRTGPARGAVTRLGAPRRRPAGPGEPDAHRARRRV